MSHILRWGSLALILNSSAPFLAAAEETETLELAPFVVTGTITPTRADEVIIPVSVLSDEELARRLHGSMGETLDGLPGVHSTAFGVGASRPVIRGFEGPRVRVLESGLDSADVSEASPDHAVSIEPFFAESIEVVRGPATLLYGSSAIGGVVNVIDRRIPRNWEENGFSGETQFRYHTVSEGWDLMGMANYSQPWYSFTIATLTREHNDYDIPGFAESARFRAAEEAEHDDDDHGHDAEEHDHEEEEETFGTLATSFFESDTISFGLSLKPREETRISFAYNIYDSAYGLPGGHAHAHGEEDHDDEHGHDDEHDDHEQEHEHGEEDEVVTIDLRQSRFDIDIEHIFGFAPLESARLRFAYTDYNHQENEGDEVGTQFDRDSWEMRLEAVHGWSDSLSGISGIQLGQSLFSATGEEAFSPPAETTDWAVFTMQEWRQEAYTVQAGARLERRDIEADIPDGEYADWAMSLSLGTFVPLTEQLSLALSIARSERLPTSTELYADGPHVATQQFEIGNPSLKTEVSYGVDATVRWRGEPITAEVTFFYTYFDDYIYLAETGDEEDGLPVSAFAANDARFIGAEGEITWHAYHGAEQDLHVSALFDLTRATNTSLDEPLPRIPPARLGGRVHYNWMDVSFASSLHYCFEQDRTAPLELATDSYLMWNADIRYTLNWDAFEVSVFCRAENLLDREVRRHTSFIKDLAPLPGRNVILGTQFAF